MEKNLMFNYFTNKKKNKNKKYILRFFYLIYLIYLIYIIYKKTFFVKYEKNIGSIKINYKTDNSSI